MFWLAQSGDDRVITFFEDILSTRDWRPLATSAEVLVVGRRRARYRKVR